MIVYHGTTVERAREILRDGFRIRKGKATNDLGNGVYTYCDDVLGAWNPRKNAKKFVNRFRNGQICILRLTVDDTEIDNNSLNLDYPGMALQWEVLRKLLESQTENKWKGFPKSNAKKRHNIDGILLEDALMNKGFLIEDSIIKNPSCILKQTYTSFVPHTISNFPNGRELVIRDLDIIKAIEIQED